MGDDLMRIQSRGVDGAPRNGALLRASGWMVDRLYTKVPARELFFDALRETPDLAPGRCALWVAADLASQEIVAVPLLDRQGHRVGLVDISDWIRTAPVEDLVQTMREGWSGINEKVPFLCDPNAAYARAASGDGTASIGMLRDEIERAEAYALQVRLDARELLLEGPSFAM